MEELINEISEKTISELKRLKKPLYPLYYKNVFNNILKEKGVYENINPKLLCEEVNISETFLGKTQETIKHVDEVSKEIKKDSQTLVEEIEPFDSEEIRKAILKFNKNIFSKIDKLEEKVKSLQQELDKVYKELLIDSLTKAYNKKALEKDLNEILKIGKQKNLNLVIAIIDFDDFKNINDTYGHLVGDFVLIKLVEIIKRLIGKEHKLYRFGGDEFILVLKGVDLKEAERIIERIVEKISHTVLKYNERLIKISVSMGVTKHKKGDTIKTLLQRADDALYEAKKEGKNRYKIKV